MKTCILCYVIAGGSFWFTQRARFFLSKQGGLFQRKWILTNPQENHSKLKGTWSCSRDRDAGNGILSRNPEITERKTQVAYLPKVASRSLLEVASHGFPRSKVADFPKAASCNLLKVTSRGFPRSQVADCLRSWVANVIGRKPAQQSRRPRVKGNSRFISDYMYNFKK